MPSISKNIAEGVILVGDTINTPSSGNLIESSGSTPVLAEASGTVTLDNVTLGSNVKGLPKVVFSASWPNSTNKRMLGEWP